MGHVVGDNFASSDSRSNSRGRMKERLMMYRTSIALSTIEAPSSATVNFPCSGLLLPTHITRVIPMSPHPVKTPPPSAILCHLGENI